MSTKRKQKSRSPLKEMPVRNPGESLDEELQRLMSEQAMPMLLVAAYVVALAGFEWWRWLTSAPPQPVAMSVIAVLALVYVAFSWARLAGRAKRLRQGLEGEKSVGQFLEANREPSWRVLHDIPGRSFNVDHVLIAPQGVFAIETKTFSKPVKGDAVVEFDGERLVVNGHEPQRNAVIQARAVRDFIRDLLYETTGIRYPVRGVILFPGWYVHGPKDRKRTDIWVLNPKAFLAFVRNEQTVVKDEDVMLAHSRLKNSVTR